MNKITFIAILCFLTVHLQGVDDPFRFGPLIIPAKLNSSDLGRLNEIHAKLDPFFNDRTTFYKLIYDAEYREYYDDTYYKAIFVGGSFIKNRTLIAASLRYQLDNKNKIGNSYQQINYKFLNAAMENNDYYVLKALLEHGVDADLKDEYYPEAPIRFPPLYSAQSIPMAELLVQHCADITWKTPERGSLLHHACHYRSSADLLDYYIKCGKLDVQEEADWGTPLHIWAYFSLGTLSDLPESKRKLQLLLDAGADVTSTRGHVIETPLDVLFYQMLQKANGTHKKEWGAAYQELIKILAAAIEKKLNIRKDDKIIGYKPIRNSLLHTPDELRSENKTGPFKFGELIIPEKLTSEDLQKIKEFHSQLSNNLDMNYEIFLYETYFNSNIFPITRKIIAQSLRFQKDKNIITYDEQQINYKFLKGALYQQDYHLIKALLEHGVDANLDHEHCLGLVRHPPIFAARSLDIAQLLIHYNADITCKSEKQGSTPSSHLSCGCFSLLHNTCHSEYPADLLGYYIKSGKFDINEESSCGTPLHILIDNCMYDFPECKKKLQFLIEAGADLTKRAVSVGNMSPLDMLYNHINSNYLYHDRIPAYNELITIIKTAIEKKSNIFRLQKP